MSNPVRLILAAALSLSSLLLLALPAAAFSFLPYPPSRAAPRRSRLTTVAAAAGGEAGGGGAGGGGATTRRTVLGQGGASLTLLSGALLGASGKVGIATAASASGVPEVTDKVGKRRWCVCVWGGGG